MKTKLLIPTLFACLFTLALQAENPFQTKNNENVMFFENSLSGDTVSIPWTEGFESISYKGQMPNGITCSYRGATKYVVTYTTSPETNSPPSQYYYYRFARTGSKFAAFETPSGIGDWLFSPAFFLRVGTTYYFSFWYITSVGDPMEELEVKAGLSASAEKMTIQVGDNISTTTNQYKKYEGSFTPTKDDFYYFGIHVAGKRYLSIDDLELNTIPTTPPLCSAVKLNVRNVTDVSAEVFWRYVPEGTKGFILSHKSTRTSNWVSEFLSSDAMSWKFTNLTDSIEVKLGTICLTGDTSWYDNQDTIKRLETPIPPGPIPIPFGKFPIDEKFDKTSGITWAFINDSTSPGFRNFNKWYIGKPQNMPDDGRGDIAFISSDTGRNNIYKTDYISGTHLFTDFILPENGEEYLLSFDWRNYGDSVGYGARDGDILRVSLTDTTRRYPTSGTVPPNKYRLFNSDFRKDSNWRRETVYLGDSISGKYRKLVFTWQNYNTKKTDLKLPAAVDNIVFKAVCGTPRQLAWKDNIDNKTLLLSCNARAANVRFDIAYREEQSGTWQIQKGALGDNKDSLVLKNLSPNTVYYVKTQRQCEEGDTSMWSESIKVSTGINSTAVPFTDNFENFEAESRGFVNGTVKNKWVVGNAVSYNDTGKALYISDNNGSNWHYNDTAQSIVHLYYDLQFPIASDFSLSFDWKGVGTSSDAMSVSIIDIDVHPEQGEILASNTRLFGKEFYYRHTTWLHEELLLGKEFSGTKKRLVFTWRNSGTGGGTQPPIAIDNISIQKFNCAAPQYLKIVGANPNSVTFMSDKLESNASFNINYRKEDSDIWLSKTVNTSDIINGYLFTLNSLEMSTYYEFRLQKQCDASNVSAFTQTVKARTTALPAQIPLTEDFESRESYSQWMIFNGTETNRWVVFDSVHYGENSKKALYIATGDERNAYKYNPSAPSVVHFCRDIEFPAAYEYELYFDWKGIGNENNYLSVYVDGIHSNTEAGGLNLSGTLSNGKHYYGSGEWQRDTVILSASQLQNKIGRLTFTWQNTEGDSNLLLPSTISN